MKVGPAVVEECGTFLPMRFLSTFLDPEARNLNSEINPQFSVL
jgi:hypothetical protein